MEVRFIAGNDGFADALHVWLRKPGSKKAVAASELAVDRLQNRWFERAENVGLHQSMDISEVRRWSDDYLSQVSNDPVAATRLLCDRIMERIALRLDASRLVDTTPANARNADRIEPIYPNSSVVVVTRDGRDVAASFVSQTFGPDEVFEALDQWERRMLRTHEATQACHPGRVLTIELMDLVVHEREETLRRLCSFLDVPVDPALVEWFDAHVTPEGAHPGRWRADFDAETCARIDQHYRDACERLATALVQVPQA